MRRQPAAAGLTEVASAAIARVPGSWSEPLRRSALPGDESGCAVAGRERRRPPGKALVKLEVRLRLFEEVPVRDWLESILPGGWSAGGRDRRRARRLTDVGENGLDGSGIGDERSALRGVRYLSGSGHISCDGACRFWVRGGHRPVTDTTSPANAATRLPRRRSSRERPLSTGARVTVQKIPTQLAAFG